MNLLQEAVVYLLAALVAVPLSKRFGFGSVLGYLAAGIVIGPATLGLVKDPDHILHFAELGVVFLLFVIGLELQPSRLWVLRKMVFGLGTAQVILSTLAIALAGMAFGLDSRTAIVVGLILSLSSTAFVLQLLAERNQLTTTHGRAAFTVLLFQDLAVIPLIALLPLLANSDSGTFQARSIVIAIVAVSGLVLGGRIILRPVLRVAARTGIPEIFTATALLVVMGSAVIMEFAGLSMVLGAFLAGMLLADSEYRHELEANIAPFKGLLLGLFFIAVGMSVNIGLLLQNPTTIAIMVVSLMLLKAAVIFPLARLFGICDTKGAISLAVVLAQGGEFAFVLFALVAQDGVIDAALIDKLVLAVALSMLLTPITFLINERLTAGMGRTAEPEYDAIEDEHNSVIIAGFGRVGQIVGRLLAIVDRKFTALEIDSSQVDVVRRYGNKVYFGDASKLDLLRAAGAQHARLFVLAIDDIEASVRTAETVRHYFPHLTIIARARNRRHEHYLMNIGVTHIYRETLLTSLAMGEQVLAGVGLNLKETREIVEIFRERDERLIREQYVVRHDEEKLIQSARETARELEHLLKSDKGGQEA
jgi:monovalent cation:proton antiporter-2 (CPA2) family protein